MKAALLPILFFCCIFCVVPLPAEQSNGKGKVFVFVDTVCPIANAYFPELGRIADKYAKAGFDFRLVYPDKRLTEEEISVHLQEYDCSIPGFIDPEHEWVKKAGVTTTPEVAVFDASETLCYRGRIDNLYTDLGDRRRQATEFYLRDVLAELLKHGTVEFSETTPVGCLIEPLE